MSKRKEITTPAMANVPRHETTSAIALAIGIWACEAHEGCKLEDEERNLLNEITTQEEQTVLGVEQSIIHMYQEYNAGRERGEKWTEEAKSKEAVLRTEIISPENQKLLCGLADRLDYRSQFRDHRLYPSASERERIRQRLMAGPRVSCDGKGGWEKKSQTTKSSRKKAKRLKQKGKAEVKARAKKPNDMIDVFLFLHDHAKRLAHSRIKFKHKKRFLSQLTATRQRYEDEAWEVQKYCKEFYELTYKYRKRI